MTRDEIDIMWQKAMQEAVEGGEMYTRYRFAKLVAKHTLLNTEQEARALLTEKLTGEDYFDISAEIKARGHT